MARGHCGGRSGEKDDERDDIVKPGILRNLQLWHSVGRAEKVLWVFSGPETAFSIDMDPVRLPPIKLITYSGSRALRQPDTERSLKKHYLKAIKNAREKNSIQLWQNIRYNPSPPFNNPHTYPLFPSTMSDSPADDTFDDHKLPDELEEGAQLAGNSDTGQSSLLPLSPFPGGLVLQ